jgi:FMN-dependent NADH-azoreductase
MTRILYILTSVMGENSKSRDVANTLVESLKADHPGATVTVRDLAAEPVPHLSATTLGAFFAPAESHTPDQVEAAALSEALIAELEAADFVVIATPMYNFSIPSTLKSWIDHVARAGRTFRYTENGAEGLLSNKPVFIVSSRGGVYSEGPAQAMDFQEPYLRTVFGFLGIKDVSVVRAEGLAISPESAEQSVSKARDEAKSAALMVAA